MVTGKPRNARRGERFNKKMLAWLRGHFPECDVRYVGGGRNHRGQMEGGIDFWIRNPEGRVALVEGKASAVWVKKSPQEGRGERYRKSHSSGVSCGRYKFSNISKAPYDTSQHGDLVAAGGWYLFWLERFGVVGALPARCIPVPPGGVYGADFTLSVVAVLQQVHPRWLKHFERWVRDGKRVDSI